MTTVYFDRKIDDDSRRRMIYDGDLFVYSANEHSLALIELARKLIAEAFPVWIRARRRITIRSRNSPRFSRSSSRPSSIIPSASASSRR